MSDPYDVLTIAAIADELAATIGGGRIQRIGLVNSRTIGAEIYANRQRHYLLASANDQRPGLRLVSTMPSLDPSLVTPFGLLLRKHGRGGVIVGIEQPQLERLVRLSIARRRIPLQNEPTASPPVPEIDDEEDVTGDDEFADSDDIVIVSLVIEIMGRHSNLILVDDQERILESAKRVTPAMSRVRVVLPRLPYAPPPPLDRRDPRHVAPDDINAILAGHKPGDDLARTLVSGYRGVSPMMAREMVYRALGHVDAPVAAANPAAVAALAQAARNLLAPLATATWQPRVYRDRTVTGDGAVATFAATPMTHLAAELDEEPVASISAAAELAADAAGYATPERHAQRRERLLAAVRGERERVDRRMAALAEQSTRAADGERWKTWGELIYASIWRIEPGMSMLDVEGERIPLNPNLSPSDNAQAYFERYRKAQGATAQLPAIVQETRAALAYLDQLATMVAQAPGFAELEALAAEWNDGRMPEAAPPKKRKHTPRRPRPLVDSQGNLVYVGHSGPQNDLLTFDLAGPDDTWLHARGVGGSHVIIRWQSPGSEEREETVSAAASLAAWYSAARTGSAVEVDVAPRRHVRKLKGAGPGMVTYRNERTIRVPPKPEQDLREILNER
ncbi:MAG: NFACT RNA binding domain-containing protein [Thermomicrobiales bacterium]